MTPGSISREEAERAFDEWGANCGPGAIAAIMAMTLDEVRPHMGDFERKRYTNPTLMFETLRRIGRCYIRLGERWPGFGLARIQWEGPWTEPGVPIAARYRHTHWVATILQTGRPRGVFDINATGNGTGWVSFLEWQGEIVPWIIRELVPGGNGRWHLTHGIEVRS